MKHAGEDARSLVVERHTAHPPEKVWRALTKSWLIEQWLMSNDFVPEVGRRFTFRAKPLPGWSGVTNCEVLTVDAPRVLAYRWGDGTESDSAMVTVVTWTLTPRGDGTLVRMEQSGFRVADESAFRRMGSAWPQVLERLAAVVGEGR